MLCFKELPHDVITVSKRSHQLRIDYHVKDLSDPLKKKGFYSLVLTAEPKAENKLFMISHGDKFICNVLVQRIQQFSRIALRHYAEQHRRKLRLY